MPGAGKSTIGQLLAQQLGFAFVDTDLLIESLYARPLQQITDALPRQTFLDMEAGVITALAASDCVIATGGSVIYRESAMTHLKKLGPVIYLNPPLAAIVERVASKPDRGISFGPGQGLAEIHAERAGLYERYADYDCNTAAQSPQVCAARIAAMLQSMSAPVRYRVRPKP